VRDKEDHAIRPHESMMTKSKNDVALSDERVGEWGLVKKMSVPAHVHHPYDRINTFLEGFYDCFCTSAFDLWAAILAA
jgi:hypothetical protein